MMPFIFLSSTNAVIALYLVTQCVDALPNPTASATAAPTARADAVRPRAPLVSIRPRSDLSCYAHADPTSGDNGNHCICESGGNAITVSQLNKDDVCGYTTMPSADPPAKPSAFTYTDATDGDIYSCASATTYNAAVNTAGQCAGASKVIGTDTSIYSSYSASTVSVESVASVASAASPTCECSGYRSTADTSRPLPILVPKS